MDGFAPQYNCEICRAIYNTEAELQQHLQGASHQKALEKLEQIKQQRGRQAKYADMIEVALQGAAWQSQGQEATRQNVAQCTGQKRQRQDDSSVQAQDNNPTKSQQPKEKKAKNVHGYGQGSQFLSSLEQPLTHEELIARKRKQEKDFSIDGWVPPSVPLAVEPQANATQESDTSQSSESEDFVGVVSHQQNTFSKLLDQDLEVDALDKQKHRLNIESSGKQDVQEEEEEKEKDVRSSLESSEVSSSQEGLKYF
eukprot:TRINITY_DN27645_c0_g1_i18.p1 TRINITY_DN27645_c0_g1~~TRINITY_DN27645_c0_g1_i18.p1  ORF type:complete len:254 (-),score=43.57 TRINITY_DN27645_c0_g1_i18:169-930(-)